MIFELKFKQLITTYLLSAKNNIKASLSDNGKGLNFRPTTPINTLYPDAGIIRIMAQPSNLLSFDQKNV